MRKQGVLITLEGPEGSGKSTQIKNMVRYFKRKGIRPVLLREPGATKVGEAIREILLHLKVNSMAPETELMLYLAARAQVVHEKILPALRQKKIVICDRFEDSTLAYQGFGRGLSVSQIQQASRLVRGILKPNLTILLDIDPKLGFLRIQRGRDRMERAPLSFHRKVRRGFLTLAKQEPRRFFVVDARQHESEITEIIQRKLDHVFC